MRELVAGGLAFCVGLLLGAVAAQAGKPAQPYPALVAAVPTCPPPACHCSFLPVVVNEPPPPTATPTCTPTLAPTWTPAPTSTQPPTPAPTASPTFTRTTLSIWPPYQVVDAGDMATVTLNLSNVVRGQAAESDVFYNPAGLEFRGARAGGFLLCGQPLGGDWQPGVVRIYCEAAMPVSGSGALAVIVYEARVPGRFLVELSAASFVGLESGVGINPAVASGVVEVK